MRPIDADGLQRSLNDYVFNDPTCPMHIAATVDQYIDFAPTVGGWISCSERLPKLGELVIVTDGVRVSATFLQGAGHYVLWKYNNFLGEITHWQPLPEPPGGDADV